MSLQNTQAKYEIIVQKVGSALPVAQELDQVAAASQRATIAGKATTAQLHALKEGATLTKESFRTLHAASLLLGGHFAEVSMAGALAVDSMKLVKGAAAATGVGIAGISAAALGAAAAIATLVTGFESLHAMKEADESAKRLREQQEILRTRTLNELQLLQIQGKITGEEYDQLRAKVEAAGDSYTKMKQAVAAVRAVDPSREETQATEKLTQLRQQLNLETLDGYAKESQAARYNFEQRRDEIRQLFSQLAKARGGKFDSADAGLMQNLLAQNEATNAVVQGRITAARQMADLEQNLTVKAIGTSETRIEQADREFMERNDLYKQLQENGEMTEDQVTQHMQEASLKRIQVMQAEADKAKLNLKSIGEQAKIAQEQFASGLSQAIVDFVSRTKDAKTAFLDFAKSFLSEILKMIIEQQILNALKSLSFANGGFAMAAASGGSFSPRYAASGVAGVSSVSSPTYFPKFNVLAGEAGREMMTVLARPRLMAIGGMEAVVGQAGGQTLAIINANQLARGRGETIRLIVEHSEESKVKIIKEAVSQAEVHVTRQTKANTPLRAAIVSTRS